MKRFILLALAVLVFGTGGCSSKGAAPSSPSVFPEESSVSQEEPVSPPSSSAGEGVPSPAEDQDLCRRILLGYGAAVPESPPKEGWLVSDKLFSLYSPDIRWDRDNPLPHSWLYSWRTFVLHSQGDLSTPEAIAGHTHPTDPTRGWFFTPGDYEDLVTSYFPVTVDYLHSDTVFYDGQGYSMPQGGGGIGMTPFISLYQVVQEPAEGGGAVLSFHISLIGDPAQTALTTFHILQVLVREDGSWQYLSFQEDPFPTPEQKAEAIVASSHTPAGLEDSHDL